MFSWILKKIAGDYNQRLLNRINPLVDEITLQYQKFDSLSDDEIKAMTHTFRQRFQQWESLDDLLPEAFAVVKQACKRMQWMPINVKGDEMTRDMIPYDVQMIGGIALHQWKIAEMKTWEWKTLVATLPAYLNALSGHPVHIVTVNDYLASRDAEWMWYLYRRLWLSVGAINKYTPQEDHQAQYECDIVYVESTEIWFDYLRDNLEKTSQTRRLMSRWLWFAIVDEADSVFIDEARTPMIMSQPNSDPIDKYIVYSQLINHLTPSSKPKKVSKWFLSELSDKKEEVVIDWDYWIDEKAKSATLTELGIEKLEKMLKVEHLYRDLGYDEIHYIENALTSKAVYREWIDYIIQWDEVLIVDENTGRVMPWRRFQSGLHQAIEAKEKLSVKQEAKTIATVTYQNFFKLYKKLAGMTGTAATEAEEFEKIYEREVLIIPTNRIVKRIDLNDKVYFNQHAKRQAVIKTVVMYHGFGQPILLWTWSIQTSELVSTLLTQQGIVHNVLNAKQFEKESHIISQAGKPGSVVVATNMAWRGTDIKLESWLNEKIAQNYAHRVHIQSNTVIIHTYSEFERDLTCAALVDGYTVSWLTITVSKWWVPVELFAQYGLFVLGTEKHESRRTDNQLRWRSGRQWDPGISQFYVALDDDIMRKMWWANIQSVAKMLLSEQELVELELTQSQFTNSIVRAQKQMESHNFSIRKHLFDYDSVINRQRLAVYAKRDVILDTHQQSQAIFLYGYKNTLEDYWFKDLWNYLANQWINTLIPQFDSASKDIDQHITQIMSQITLTPATTLIWYSMWWIISAKILEQYVWTIDRLILLAVPDFDINIDINTISSKVNNVIVIQPQNDTIAWNQQKRIDAGATYINFDNRINHLMWDEPELIELLYQHIDPIKRTWLYEEISWFISEIMTRLSALPEFERTESLNQIFALEITQNDWRDHIESMLQDYYQMFLRQMTLWQLNQYLTTIYLDTLDRERVEHIDTMHHLREKVGLYGYAQQDPLTIYKQEWYDMYESLWRTVKEKIVWTIFHHRAQNITTVQAQAAPVAVEVIEWQAQISNATQSHVVIAPSKKTRPNDPCPCWSGKKYKNCHGNKD